MANNSGDSFLKKLRLYFEENPGRCCDVTFVIGSTKEIVKTSRIMLEVACPAFRALFDTWGQAAVKEREEATSGILLPEIDPQAFKIFLMLLFNDLEDISADDLKQQKFSFEDLLNVAELCQEYKMNDLWDILQSLVNKSIFCNFSAFAKSNDFLKLSSKNLLHILKHDKLQVEETVVVKSAIKWAEYQCAQKQQEKTGENLRAVLGDALFQIRFPTMSFTDFGNELQLKDLLSSEEQLEIFRYMSLTDENRSQHDLTNLAFPADRRIPEILTVEIFNDFKWSASPGFICNGEQNENLTKTIDTGCDFSRVKINRKMEIHSFGFKGPIDSDSNYEVSIEINKYNGPDKGTCFGKATKTVVAPKDSIFHVSFDEPIVLKPSSGTDPRLGYWYTLRFSLTGPPTHASDFGGTSSRNILVENDFAGFYFEQFLNPMAELRYKLL